MTIPSTDITISDPTAVVTAVGGAVTALAWFKDLIGGRNRLAWLTGALLFNVLVVMFASALPELGHADRARGTVVAAVGSALLIAGLWTLACPTILDRLQGTGLLAAVERLKGNWRKVPVALGFIPLILLGFVLTKTPEDETTILVANVFDERTTARALYRKSLADAAERLQFRIVWSDVDQTGVHADDPSLRRVDGRVYGVSREADGEKLLTDILAESTFNATDGGLAIEIREPRRSTNVRTFAAAYVARITELLVVLIDYAQSNTAKALWRLERMDKNSVAEDRDKRDTNAGGMQINLRTQVEELVHFAYRRLCSAGSADKKAGDTDTSVTIRVNDADRIEHRKPRCDETSVRTAAEAIEPIALGQLDAGSPSRPLLTALGDLIVDSSGADGERLNAAITWYERALAITSDFGPTHRGIATALILSRRVCDAIEHDHHYNEWWRRYHPGEEQDAEDQRRSKFLEASKRRCDRASP